jgi:hypothetical protein
MSIFHRHKWQFIEQGEKSISVERWDGMLMYTKLMCADFICHCGLSKEIITDRTVKDGTFTPTEKT